MNNYHLCNFHCIYILHYRGIFHFHYNHSNIFYFHNKLHKIPHYICKMKNWNQSIPRYDSLKLFLSNPLKSKVSRNGTYLQHNFLFHYNHLDIFQGLFRNIFQYSHYNKHIFRLSIHHFHNNHFCNLFLRIKFYIFIKIPILQSFPP